MIDTELCREVADKVLELGQIGRLNVTLTWNDAGRIIARLESLGYVVTLIAAPENILEAHRAKYGPDDSAKKYTAIVTNNVDDFDHHYAQNNESLLRALFEAALKAVGGAE